MSKFGVLAKMGMDTTNMKKGITTLSDKFKTFGSNIGGYIKKGALAAGAAITAFALKGAKDLADFDNGMQEVFTLMPNASAKATEQMKKDLRELAATMGLDVMDSVDSLYQAISAGIDPDSAINFIGEAAKLSIAGVSSLEDAVTAVTTVLNGYNLGAEETTRVSDVLFATVQIGVTNMTELSQAIGRVTPIAASLGISFEEVGAMFAVMTKQMGAGKTTEAGTAIQAMLAELSKSTSLASKNFHSLTGQSFPEFISAGNTVVDALTIMKDGAEGTSGGLKNMFSGIKSGQAALMLMSSNGKALSVALTHMVTSAGSVEVGFETMEQSVGRQFQKMISAGEELGMQMGAALLPIANTLIPMITDGFKSAMPAIQEFAEGFPDLVNNVMHALDAFVDIAIVIGTYVAATKGAVAIQGAYSAALATGGVSIKGFQAAIKALSTAMLLNPWGLAIAGAVALGLAIKGLLDIENDRREAAETRGKKRREETAKQNQEYIDEIDKLKERYDAAKLSLEEWNKVKRDSNTIAGERDAIENA